MTYDSTVIPLTVGGSSVSPLTTSTRFEGPPVGTWVPLTKPVRGLALPERPCLGEALSLDPVNGGWRVIGFACPCPRCSAQCT